MVDKLAVSLTRGTQTKLERAFTDGMGFEGAEIEIILSLREGEIHVREMAAYFEMADRVYGRSFETGLIGYALRPVAQLRISDIRKGSTEFIIADSLVNFLRENGSSMIYLFLFLKYGPTAITTITTAVKNAVETYKTYWEVELAKANILKAQEEMKLAKANRKQIVQEMKNDERLRELNEREREMLRRLMSETENSEKHLLVSSQRFAARSIKEISFRIKKRPKK